MSDLKINNITDRTGDSGPVIAGVSTVSTTGSFVVPVGATEFRGGRGRGITGGGFVSPASQNVMDYVEIATTGNALDFGDLTSILRNIATCASSTRGTFAGGQSPGNTNIICYTTISSKGGANDFGDLSTTMTNSNDGVLSDNTRGIVLMGSPADIQGSLEFITIPTTGDSSGFGELSLKRRHTATMASPTRGIFASGKEDVGSTFLKLIDYVTIQTKGTAVKFGETLAIASEQSVGSGNKTRGLICGGLTPSLLDTIEYITIATEGTATDFGNLTDSRHGSSSMSSSTRACVGGGTAPGNSNIIDYVTITSTGNAIDFGDLTVARTVPQGLSDSHGGLG
jgi:hypothetical protein